MHRYAISFILVVALTFTPGQPRALCTVLRDNNQSTLTLFITAKQCFSCQSSTFSEIIKLSKSRGFRTSLSILVDREGDSKFVLPNGERFGFDTVVEDIGGAIIRSTIDSVVYPTLVVNRNGTTKIVRDPVHHYDQVVNALGGADSAVIRDLSPLADSLVVDTVVAITEDDETRLLRPTAVVECEENFLLQDNAQNRVLLLNPRTGAIRYVTPPIDLVAKLLREYLADKLGMFTDLTEAEQRSFAVSSGIGIRSVQYNNGTVGTLYMGPFYEKRDTAKNQVNAHWGSLYLFTDINGKVLDLTVAASESALFGAFDFSEDYIACQASSDMAKYHTDPTLPLADTLVLAAAIDRHDYTINLGKSHITPDVKRGYKLMGFGHISDFTWLNGDIFYRISVQNSTVSKFLLKDGVLTGTYCIKLPVALDSVVSFRKSSPAKIDILFSGLSLLQVTDINAELSFVMRRYTDIPADATTMVAFFTRQGVGLLNFNARTGWSVAFFSVQNVRPHER